MKIGEVINISQSIFRHSTTGGLRDEPYRTSLLGLGYRLRRLRAARSFRVGGARVRAGFLLLGPEPQVSSAGSRIRYMVGAGHDRLGPVRVADLEGDPGASAHPRYRLDRGGRGGAQRRPEPLSKALRRSLLNRFCGETVWKIGVGTESGLRGPP